MLTLSAYETIALVFGLIGLGAAVRRPTIFTGFLAWWFVLAFVIYTWAGEKMPWLTIHIALPLTILAGWFLGRLFSQPRPWRLAVPKIAARRLGRPGPLHHPHELAPELRAW